MSPSSNKVCARVIVRGRVQGVFFRSETAHMARQYGLHGWVHNKGDGSVEACFEGSKASVEALVAWCHQGPPAAYVDAVEVSWHTPENFTGFQITY